MEFPRAQTRCGRPAYNVSDRNDAQAIALRVFDAFAGYDFIAAPSGSCAGMLKVIYPELFADDPENLSRAHALAEKSWELICFLADVGGMEGIAVYWERRVTHHDACSGLREFDIKRQPRRLLASVSGLSLNESLGAEVCCGFGGAFCIKYPEISDKMVTEKAVDIVATDADAVLAGDLGCLLNIAGKLCRQGPQIQAQHVAEVLAGMTAEVPPIGVPR